MGVNIFTFCRTCHQMAPELGDGGFTGRLTTERSPQTQSGEPESFGYIYSGFEAVGGVTYELSRFRQFLLAHAQHDLATMSDGGPAEAEFEKWPGAGERDDGEEDRDDELPEGWHYAHLEAVCHTCKKRRRTESADAVLERAERPITESEAELFKRVCAVIGDDMYRCTPFDDDLGQIANFLMKHRGHLVATRVVTAEET